MKNYNRLLDDICLCTSKECPKYQQCLRGIGYENAKGIYTVAALAQECKNNYIYFMEDDNND